MPTPVVLPKQGNSVESCVINKWLKKIGETVAEGEPVCEVETDKASVEILAPAAGLLLAQFSKEGDDVPVMTNIAAIGTKGEDVSSLTPAFSGAAAQNSVSDTAKSQVVQASAAPSVPNATASQAGASPRARAAAAQRGVDADALSGSGPGGLVIERDVLAAPRLTPAAQALGGIPPSMGTGIGGRISSVDMQTAQVLPAVASANTYTDIPVKSVRKIIAERMRASLASSAQLTLTATAKADTLQAWRAKAKAQSETLGLPGISINDLILFAVARVLPRFPECNAHWLGDRIRRFQSIHLGMAVDTEKGLLVPVLKDMQTKSLAVIAGETKALAKACQAGKIQPELLQGSTFSVTNVGALGIETFTPVLNTPEVAILGVGAITLRPYHGASAVEFVPSIHLSLTIDHQALDGAPAARFLHNLVQAIENIDVLLAQ